MQSFEDMVSSKAKGAEVFRFFTVREDSVPEIRRWKSLCEEAGISAMVDGCKGGG